MGRQQSRRELAAVHRLISGLPRDNGASGDGRERLVAEGFEDVVAAFEQLAREREARAVAADPLGELLVVGAVGAGGEPGALRGFVERPAQRGWSLAGEVPGGAVIVGLVDGDVQPGVADDVAGVVEAADVAELGEDRDRGQLPDPVDLRRSAPGSPAACGHTRAGPDRTGRA